MVIEDWVITLIGGAIVAGSIELIHLIKRIRQRKKYLKIICDHIDNGFLQIKNTVDHNVDNNNYTKSQIQFTIFDAVFRKLNSTLDIFQNSFKPVEVLEIKTIIDDVTQLISLVKPVNRIIDEQIIFQFHQKLKNLKWLPLKKV